MSDGRAYAECCGYGSECERIMIIKQSAVVPYLRQNGALHFVLITTNSGKWIFPKGLIEPGLSHQDRLPVARE